MIFERKKSNLGGMIRPIADVRELTVLDNAFGVDLGTNNIKIYNQLTGRILVQKNMIAVRDRRQMIAYGDAAFEMFERAPANIRISSPMNAGVIADIQNMELLMQSFLKDEQRGRLAPADFFVAIPTDVTEVERRAFYDLIRDAGIKARQILAVEKPVADALGLGIDVKNAQGVLMVDIGYDTTEISLLSLGGIVLSRLIKVGGHLFDNSIVAGVRREYNLVIGSKTAENIRLGFHGNGYGPGGYPSTLPIYGRDIVTGLPMERQLSFDFVEETLKESVSTIIDNVKVILERTPPELSADIYRHGVFVTGGAAEQEGLLARMEEEIGLPVNIAKTTLGTAALGLAEVMKKIQYRSLAYTIEGLS